MDSVLIGVARLASVTGLPGDTTENVFNCGFIGAPVGGDAAAFAQNIVDFYNVLNAPATQPVSNYIGDSISRGVNACSVLVYFQDDLTGATEVGSPVATANFTMGAGGADVALPEEVSSVISYHADLTDIPVTAPNPTPPPATIRPQQRRRGRSYIGPLRQGAGVESSNMYRPAAAFRTTLAESFRALQADVQADTTGVLVVWSRADAECYAITGGWIDDAWDTQRRRGLEASVRTTFTTP